MWKILQHDETQGFLIDSYTKFNWLSEFEIYFGAQGGTGPHIGTFRTQLL